MPLSGGTAGHSFDEAVARLVSDPEPHTRDLLVVQRGLHRLLGARFPRLPEAERSELADEAITRLVEQTRTGAGAALSNPAAYLSTVARNLALDRTRKADPVELSEDLPNSDDAIAALLDRDATAAAVQTAMQTAIAAEDHVAVRVVAAWLNLAERGEQPSSRDVAALARTSHTTVNEALRRFRGYFPKPPGQSSSE